MSKKQRDQLYLEVIKHQQQAAPEMSPIPNDYMSHIHPYGHPMGPMAGHPQIPSPEYLQVDLAKNIKKILQTKNPQKENFPKKIKIFPKSSKFSQKKFKIFPKKFKIFIFHNLSKIYHFFYNLFFLRDIMGNIQWQFRDSSKVTNRYLFKVTK